MSHVDAPQAEGLTLHPRGPEGVCAHQGGRRGRRQVLQRKVSTDDHFHGGGSGPRLLGPLLRS